jgi:hypothetical protein
MLQKHSMRSFMYKNNIPKRITTDIELEFLANTINQIEGIVFSDASFGHPEDPNIIGNHSTCAHIGVYTFSQDGVVFLEQVAKHFENHQPCTEQPCDDPSWVKIRVSLAVNSSTIITLPAKDRATVSQVSPYFTIEVYPAHNPVYNEQGTVEKLHGIKLLENFILETFK